MRGMTASARLFARIAMLLLAATVLPGVAMAREPRIALVITNGAYQNFDPLRATGEDGKGCAVWCTLDAYSHERYPIELGIPEVLAYLEDRLFEGMPVANAMEWPAKFLAAVKVGADLSGVWPRFAYWLLTEELPDVGDATRVAIDGTADLHAAQIEGLEVPLGEWNAAADAAYSASAARAAAYTDYAARAAASAASAVPCPWSIDARAAVRAAASAAANAANAAAYSARAAAYTANVAYAAASAASADANAYRECCLRQAEKLLEIISSVSP